MTEQLLVMVQTPLKDGRQKKRAMDNFLEQLKRDQAEREERLKYRAEQGKLIPLRPSSRTQLTSLYTNLLPYRWFLNYCACL